MMNWTRCAEAELGKVSVMVMIGMGTWDSEDVLQYLKYDRDPAYCNWCITNIRAKMERLRASMRRTAKSRTCRTDHHFLASAFVSQRTDWRVVY